MIKIIADQTHGDLLALEVTGKLTEADYQTINPVIDKTVDRHGKIKLYVEIKDLDGFTPKAAWEDVKEINHLNQCEKMAIAGQADWQATVTELTNLVTPADVRYFDIKDRQSALRWVEGKKTLSR